MCYAYANFDAIYVCIFYIFDAYVNMSYYSHDQ